MSFGVPRTISPIGHRIEAADEAGIVVVAGAGNENRDQPVYYPGDHSRTILVTALDSLDVKADFADYNEEVHVSAPGTGVRSAYPGSEWALGDGCSFATPFVTGEVALMLARAPGMWPELVEERVRAAVDSIYTIPANVPYEDELGAGRIYLPAAVADLVVAVPGAGTVVRRLRVAPNPTSGALRVDVSLWQEALAGSAAAIDIFTASGRRVRSFTVKVGDGLLWDGLDARGGEVPAGVYFLRLSGDGRTLGTTSVQKLR
jgi:subtilisin family serine protease